MDAMKFREVQEEGDIGRAHLALLIVPVLLSVYLWAQLGLPWSLPAIAVVWVVDVYLGLKVVGMLPGRTNEMRVDRGGIELEIEERHTRIPWQDISRLTVMRLPSKKAPRWYLVAWLRPGFTVPDDPKGALPAFDHNIGGLRLCDIRAWDYTEAEITQVLREYAGDAWAPMEKAS